MQGEITAPGGYALPAETFPQSVTTVASASETTGQHAEMPLQTAEQSSTVEQEQCRAYETVIDALHGNYMEWTTIKGIGTHNRHLNLTATHAGTTYALDIDGENTVRVEHTTNKTGDPVTTREAFYPDYTGNRQTIRIDQNGYLMLTDEQARLLYRDGRDSGNPVADTPKLELLQTLLESAEPPRVAFSHVWNTANELRDGPATLSESQQGANELNAYVQRRIWNHLHETEGPEHDALVEAGRYTKIVSAPPNEHSFTSTSVEYTVNAHEAAIDGPSFRFMRLQHIDADGRPARTQQEVKGVQLDGLHLMGVNGTELNCGVFSATAYEDSYIEAPVVIIPAGPEFARLARDFVLQPNA